MKIFILLLLLTGIPAIATDKKSVKKHIEDLKAFKHLVQLKQRAAASVKHSPALALKYSEEGITELLKLKNNPGNRVRSPNKMLAEFYFTKGQSLLHMLRYKEAADIYHKSLDIFKHLKSEDRIYRCYNSLGNAYLKMTDSVNAIKYYNLALKGYEKFKELHRVAGTLRSIGRVYYQLGTYDKSLKYYTDSLKIYRSKSNRLEIAELLNYIGTVHFMLKDYDRSEEFINEALEIHKDLKNIAGIATYYTNYGNIASKRGKYKEALQYYNKSLELSKKAGRMKETAIVMGNIGLIYCKKEFRDLDKALDYHMKAYKLRQATKDRWGIIRTQIYIGFVYILKKDFSKSLEFLNRSLKRAEEQKATSLINSSLMQLYRCYNSMGDHKKALSYYKRAVKIREKLFNEKYKIRIALINARNEIEKRERELKLIETERRARELELEKERSQERQIAIIAAILITLIIIQYILHLRRKKRPLK